MPHDEILAKDVRDILNALQRKHQRDPAKNIADDLKSFAFKSGEEAIELRQLSHLPDLVIRNGGRILHGSGGIVIECHDLHLPERKYALKIQRPSLADLQIQGPDSAEKEIRAGRLEALNTAILSHHNVIHLVGISEITIGHPPLGLTVTLLEWIEGAKALNKFIYEDHGNWNVKNLVGIFEQVLEGLDYVHNHPTRSLIHWDMKSSNCLVTKRGVVKVTDFGNCRQAVKAPPTSIQASTRLQTPGWRRSDPGRDAPFFDGGRPSGKSTIAYTSKENAPQILIDSATKSSDPNRVHILLDEVGSKIFDTPGLDLYATGRMIARILGFEKELDEEQAHLRAEFLRAAFPADNDDAQFALKYLFQLTKRLTYGMDGLPPKPFPPAKSLTEVCFYRTAREVLADLRKLLPEFGAASGLVELYAVPQRVLRVPVTRNTEYSSRIKALIKSHLVARLQRHAQLGLTSYVYPAARHTRFEHTVGVIGTTLEYVRALYANRTSPDFRLLCREEHIRALLFAAAIHDVGHVAFSHYLEEWGGLFKGCRHEDYAQALLRGERSLYSATLDPESPPGIEVPQGRATVALERFDEDRKAIDDCLQSGWAVDADPQEFLTLVADILKPRMWNPTDRDALLDRDLSERAIIHVLHSIIDGPIDADKSDYLRRDSHHSGLDYASGADLDRFFQSLTTATNSPPQVELRSVSRKPPQTHEQNGQEIEGGTQVSSGKEDPHRLFSPTIAVSRKGILPVESLLVARYQVFNSLYWHRTARGATAVLQYLVWRFLQPIGASFDESAFAERRNALLSAFSSFSDDQALVWLGDEVSRAHADIGYEDRFKRLRQAIVHRHRLPESILDTSYAEIVGYANNETGAIHGLLTLTEREVRLNNLHPDRFTEKRTAILQSTCDSILSACAKITGRQLGIVLNETMLFPDIPLGAGEQVDNLWVVDRAVDPRRLQAREVQPMETDTGGGVARQSDRLAPTTSGMEPLRVMEFEKHSPMGLTIREAFPRWSKRLRIFMLPEPASEIVAALKPHVENPREELSVIAFWALIRAFEDTELPTEEDLIA